MPVNAVVDVSTSVVEDDAAVVVPVSVAVEVATFVVVEV